MKHIDGKLNPRQKLNPPMKMMKQSQQKRLKRHPANNLLRVCRVLAAIV